MSDAQPTSSDATLSPQAAVAKNRAMRQFEKWALSYDRSLLNGILFYPCIRRCQEEIIRWRQAENRSSYDVLDVGCGTGTLLSLLSRDDAAQRMVALDYSPMMVAKAQEKFQHLPAAERLSAVQGDAEHLPFDDQSFDVLTCCNSFHHYPHQDAAVREFHRVLRPGGMLLLMDGFRDNVLGFIIFEIGVKLAERHIRHARAKEVRRMSDAAGFVGTVQSKMNVFTPVLVTRARR